VVNTAETKQPDASPFLASQATEEKTIEWEGRKLTFVVRKCITRKVRGQILNGVYLEGNKMRIDFGALSDALYDAFVVTSPIPRNQLPLIDARLSSMIEDQVLPNIGDLLGAQISSEVKSNLSGDSGVSR
jgi:hypothetical protein